MKPCAIIHYHELALKGRNRGFFEQRLVHHLRSALKTTGITQVEALPGRILISFNGHTNWPRIHNQLKRTFGIANFSLAHQIPFDRHNPDLTTLSHAIHTKVEEESFDTFRISTKRAEKRFSKTSMDINREIGAFICERTGKHVKLKNPDLHIMIEILRDDAYFSMRREPGSGGLPTGISGKVLTLISGGIDSPVAAYRMMKRGCNVVFVHFHGRPYLSRVSEEKVRDLVGHLTQCQLYPRLFLVPFGDIQRPIVVDAPPAVRVVLYRRMMMRIAEKVAIQENCWGLVTGDSLGQVASQTPENLQVVSTIPDIPILRPLIGMDKIEITQQAQDIGTFETSIEPDQDCCTLFVPPHPSTKTRLDHIQKIEERFDMESMVQQGLRGMEFEEFQLNPKG
jgi:thiamine biosynthesis protein ThiI